MPFFEKVTYLHRKVNFGVKDVYFGWGTPDPPPMWTGYLSDQGLAIAIAKASCDHR